MKYYDKYILKSFNYGLFLNDLSLYCIENNINFKDMPQNEIKKHIRIMLKRIANKKSLKNP